MRWPARTPEDRYREKVDERGPDDCWPWAAGTQKGYGALRFRVDGKWRYVMAHRLAWELANGPIENPSLYVCHNCDNRLCQNPAHLFLGTNAENLADMRTKGRGSTPPRSRPGQGGKLTPEQVLEIRRRYAAGELQREIAAEYGIHQVNVSCIVTGKSWRHLPFS